MLPTLGSPVLAAVVWEQKQSPLYEQALSELSQRKTKDYEKEVTESKRGYERKRIKLKRVGERGRRYLAAVLVN
jgi:chromosome segregation and condensation protein ScpB